MRSLGHLSLSVFAVLALMVYSTTQFVSGALCDPL